MWNRHVTSWLNLSPGTQGRRKFQCALMCRAKIFTVQCDSVAESPCLPVPFFNGVELRLHSTRASWGSCGVLQSQQCSRDEGWLANAAQISEYTTSYLVQCPWALVVKVQAFMEDWVKCCGAGVCVQWWSLLPWALRSQPGSLRFRRTFC